MFEIDMLRVVLSGIAAVVLGMVWYHPKIWGTVWMNTLNLTDAQKEAGKKTMLRSSVLALVSNTILAYVFAHFAIAWGVFDAVGAIQLAFWTWLGLQVPVSLSMVLWEQRPWKWFLITSGYWLVFLVAVSLVLSL
jgi:hypothetical protein